LVKLGKTRGESEKLWDGYRLLKILGMKTGLSGLSGLSALSLRAGLSALGRSLRAGLSALGRSLGGADLPDLLRRG
jgi:hypothetical protein